MRKIQVLLILICITSCTQSGSMVATDEHINNCCDYPTIYVDGICRTLDTAVFLCDTFEVVDIYKRKGCYGIDVKRQNRYYPIISCLKHPRQIRGKKISKGDRYVLTLIPIFEEDRFPGGLVHHVVINNMEMKLSRVYSTNLYLCLDLNGVYYCGNTDNIIP